MREEIKSVSVTIVLDKRSIDILKDRNRVEVCGVRRSLRKESQIKAIGEIAQND